MLHFLRGGDKACVTHRALLDFVNHFLAFFNQPFHRHAFDAAQFELRHAFYHLIDAFNLAPGFLEVSAECRGQLFIRSRACKLRQSAGQLFLCAIGV